ncbi:DUF72 domain-containing protein [Paracoccus marinaquae]|uniref:DUF72 domain-containing protein n=1 Tax=Paracoccus marinaquae TaxID=2841926 RepID=A0ABS6AI92_9RHOB|nr:DUF72 domain-containing protein [Paracoccus marinaquae]MBU3029921.1 DUF72 domain-containing protein [Paracoccus marinaquae]
MIRIGIGGWNFAPWRGVFYPEGLPQRRELEYASRALSSIEINATYYGSQKPVSFQKWHDETPDDFVFAVKGPRFATNRRVLAEAGDSIARFLDSGVTRLAAKLGPINWQFAETKAFDTADFGAFLTLLPDSHDGLPLRHAIEARHASFACDTAATLCRDRNIALIRACDGKFPEIDLDTADFAYLRLMGTTDLPQGYPDAALDDWARQAREIARGRDLYLYVISGEKPRNPAAALALIERLS